MLIGSPALAHNVSTERRRALIESQSEMKIGKRERKRGLAETRPHG
jgi:hypothetical protein